MIYTIYILACWLDLISDCENSFALVCHSSSHQYFPIYPFAVKDSDVKKDKFLEELHKAYEFLPTVTLEPVSDNS